MSSLSANATLMFRLAGYLPSLITTVQKEIAYRVDEYVVRATPIDTGLARSNWIVTVDSLADYTIFPFSPYPSIWEHGSSAYGQPAGLRFGETANADAAISAGTAVIDGVVPGQKIYIQNNVKYIGSLNNGHSGQAGEYFVENAVRVTLNSLSGWVLTIP